MTTQENGRFETGNHLGNYVILEKIDESDVHIAYSAVDKVLDRHVAVKILRGPYSTDPAVLSKFKEKAREVSVLSHKHIGPLYSIGFDEGVYYLATGYIRGYTLEDWLLDDRIFDAGMALWFMTQAVAALEFASRSNILHLNIRPVVFVVDWDNVVVLINMGLVQCRNLLVGIEKYDCLGTPTYASPEHISGVATDIRSDMYCLGVMLFHLMAGQPPFEAPTSDGVCKAHLQDPFPENKALELGIPVAWIKLIRRLMEKEPEKRFQTYRELSAVFMSVA